MYGWLQTCRAKGFHFHVRLHLRLQCIYLETSGFVLPTGLWWSSSVLFKVELQFLSVFVCLHVALSFYCCVATAGGQGSCESFWFPWRVTLLLCPHFEITFPISQAHYDTGVASLFLNCLQNHRAIDDFPDIFQGQRCIHFLNTPNNSVCLILSSFNLWFFWSETFGESLFCIQQHQPPFYKLYLGVGHYFDGKGHLSLNNPLIFSAVSLF